MNVFLTSNQQFGRKGAIKAYGRPFESVDEMNQHLISQWNSVVSDGDVVFVLGNFAWDPETTEYVLNQLNGDICMMEGEWDQAVLDLIGTGNTQIDLIEEGIHVIPDASLCLSYWPLHEWPGKKKDWATIIGYPGKKYKTSHIENRLNVSCDFWDFKPIKAKSILGLFEDLKSSK